jgi:imidazolonepropionase-like amidohydrolase
VRNWVSQSLLFNGSRLCRYAADRLENLQFSEGELRAIVEEARNAGVYCAAHAYTDAAGGVVCSFE